MQEELAGLDQGRQEAVLAVGFDDMVTARKRLEALSTIVGHAASASAFAVAAVSCFNQRAPEPFTSRGGALRRVRSRHHGSQRGSRCNSDAVPPL